jgi:uncharacterized protein (DUF433 family)
MECERGKDMAHERIVRDPEIMMGKPTIRGTRIAVELILRKLGAGVPIAEVLAAHPRLVREDILAAQAIGDAPLCHCRTFDPAIHG